ncbi:sigma-54 interaction domain-containing protein [Thalassoglobus polymorphus]|uniref:Transcriptional regulatory protein ZraR n=1 Tax=Thalassoglobus polymorphus TaxID=2527994 RepID=A0A517QLE2_9PLAN|nr:sigma-54 dependent transcriptional regulator [Thalassoglobus polymorphus]QDT32460.1 Transcriptional regulatory protein ZraR [Thalassoglobus polymorphus]
MDSKQLDSPPFDGFIGASERMRELFRHLRKIANSSATVLLLGETGTGKELAARSVHDLSPRATGPFIRVNCGALSESLLESELFGHVKGAFTNAIENRTGRFEAAHGGTIFLDEINSVSPTLQVKLLRVLQEHEFERVGDTKTVTVDCRVIAATNRDLAEMVETDGFREDLYYRLNVLPLYVPPLRERREDIPELVQFFVNRYAIENQRIIRMVSQDALDFLKSYLWPGNVRELQNYIERAIVLADGDELTADLLPSHVRGEAPIRLGRIERSELQSLCAELVERGLSEVAEDGKCHEAVMGLVERELILQVLRSCQGTQTKTATKLGINRNTLHKKIDDYSLQDDAR